METDDPEMGGEDSEDAREKHQGGPEDILHSEKEIETRSNKNSERSYDITHSNDNRDKKGRNGQ